MQIIRDTKADVIYIRLSEKPIHNTKTLGNGLVAVDLSEDGKVVGIELVSPSEYVDNSDEITFTLTDERKVVKS
jgi:uncharacterized protein YuzE